MTWFFSFIVTKNIYDIYYLYYNLRFTNVNIPVWISNISLTISSVLEAKYTELDP